MITLDTLNSKNFRSRLDGWAKRSHTLRDELQSFIMFGLIHYGEHCDTQYLTNTIVAVSNIKSIPAKTIQQYIMAHANVYLAKDKTTGQPVFKKRNGEKVSEITMPDLPWYDHEVNNKNKVDFNLARYEKAVIAKLIKEGVEVEKFISDLTMAARSLKKAG